MQSLFDRSYYLSHNIDVACMPEIDPLEHYLSRGWSEGRNPHPLFDTSFYLENNPEVAQQRINPLLHFLNEGARRGLDPHPLFSSDFYLTQGITLEDCDENPLLHYLSIGAEQRLDPHPLFRSKYYLHRLRESGLNDLPKNPLVHYLTSGKTNIDPSPIFDSASYAMRYHDVKDSNISPLLHYVRFGQQEGRMGLRLTNLSHDINAISSQPFKDARAILHDVTRQSFSHIIVISCLMRGGYERCASNFAEVISQRVGINNVLFLLTDLGEITCSDWLPENVRIVNLASMFPALSREEKAILFMDLIARRRPSTVIAINAPLFWSALDTYTEAWEKEELSTRLMAYLGSYEHYVDYNNHGFKDGALARLIEKIDLFITDTERLRDAMVQTFKQVPFIESKVAACYKSLSKELHQSLSSQARELASPSYALPAKDEAPARVLWASRMEDFKQPDVLAKIALKMPDITFEVYGRCDAEFSIDSLSRLSNVHLKGEFRDFAAIPKDGIAIFLYTSKVDGMPHVLLEAGAYGLPVVAPLIGGIGELIDDSNGWLVSRADNVEEYVRQIRLILDEPQLAHRRASKLQARVNERHKWSAFVSRVEELRIADDPGRNFKDGYKNKDESSDYSAILDSEFFDGRYYLEQYPDVAKRNLDPLKHYLLHGAFEKRNPHPIFDSAYYCHRAKRAGKGEFNPLVHFLLVGARQGIDPHPLFSTSFYLEQGLTMEDCEYNALAHYLRRGASDGLDPHPLFDGRFYLRQAEKMGLSLERENPLAHYIKVGSKLGLSPGPDFDAKAYYERYRDIAAAGVNPLVHYLTLGESEGRTRRKIEGILDTTESVRSASFQRALKKLRALTQTKFSHLIVSESLTRGGAVRCACQFFSAIAQRVGLDNAVFLIADELDVTCEDWLPSGSRIINLPHLDKNLSFEDRSLLLLELAARVHPKIVMGFNSYTFWKTLDWHIDACLRELATKFVGYLGGYEDYVEMNGWGFNDGPVNTLTPRLPLIVTDNDRLRNIMLQRHKSVPSIETKVVTCYKSLTVELMQSLNQRAQLLQDKLTDHSGDTQAQSSIHKTNAAQPLKVLWASRLDGVKQPEILAAIAEQMPDILFDVYGRGYNHIDVRLLRELENVRLMGEYSDFSEIPLHDKSIFLHTSRSDSMPHVLVEAAAAGMPIVTPDTGAIRELIDETTGWIVADCNNTSAYVAALGSALNHRQEAQHRAGKLLAKVREIHGWEAFLARVERLDIW